MEPTDAQNVVITELSIRHYEKRVEVYPALYKILSEFIKILDHGKFDKDNDRWTEATKQDVTSFLLNLEQWDSEFAIFLTPHSVSVLYQLRTQIYTLVKGDEKELKAKMEGNNSQLSKCVSRLESSLKYDLGIYTIYPFPGIGGFNPLGSYEDTEKEMRKIRDGEEI